MLAAVAGCHLGRKQNLPDPAQASGSLTSVEVLAVGATRDQGCHVCQSSSRPLYGLDGLIRAWGKALAFSAIRFDLFQDSKAKSSTL